MKLTTAQHAALGRARRKTGAPVSGPRPLPDGTRAIPEGHVSPQTANVLIDAGLALIVDGTLRATREGRREFDRPRPEDPDVWLRNGDGLTVSRKDAVLAEGPVLDAHTLRPFWREQAELKKAATKTGRAHAKELRKASRNWPTSGPVAPVRTHWCCPACGGDHPLRDHEEAG